MRFEETISDTRLFWYSQYLQKRKSVVYFKFDCFELPSSAVCLFKTAIIGSFVRVYVNLHSEYLLNVSIKNSCFQDKAECHLRLETLISLIIIMLGTSPPPSFHRPSTKGGYEEKPTKNCAKNGASGICTGIYIHGWSYPWHQWHPV